MKIKKYLILLLFVQLNLQVYSQVVNKNGQQVLENVENTTDLNKPISDATQAALDLKATIASPTFTGTVNATAFVGNGSGLTGISGDAITQAGTGLIISGTGTVADPYTIELPAGGTEGQVLKIVGGVPIWSDASGATIFYEDTDGDGYGDFTKTIVAASAPTGYVSDNTDCDDTNSGINPVATDVCDGVDNDCDGSIDEGLTFTTYYTDADTDGYGDIDDTTGALYCSDPGAGFSLTNNDCDDSNSTVSPGATEFCDGLDNDCDGSTDEGLTFTTYYTDSDGDGYGDSSDTAGTSYCVDPGSGYSLTNDDCDDLNSTVSPGATEICDGLDNDCDGSTDEGLTFTTYYTDSDGDGYGDPSDTAGTSYCVDPGSAYSLTNDDCDDSNSAINPGATEIGGNSVDENCDGNLNVVGDYAEGGIVFYIAPTPTDLNGDSAVDFGLVCSIADLSTGIKWSSITIETKAWGENVGTGKDNTDLIVAKYGSSTNYAAGLAQAYTGGGYTDWFLPSKVSVKWMWKNSSTINATAELISEGSALDAFAYWSSTEFDFEEAWRVKWSNGSSNRNYKIPNSLGVRAVRAF